MKTILLFLTFGISFISCSDNLTTSKTDKLIKEALAETTPFYGVARVVTGQRKYILKEELATYEKLAQEGYITMKKSDSPLSNDTYDITFNDKSQPFIIAKSYDGYYMQAYTLVFDKTDEIQIIMQNKARVKAIFEKKERTPFYNLSFLAKEDSYMRTFTFDKTENKGWVTHSVLPMLRLSKGIAQKEQ